MGKSSKKRKASNANSNSHPQQNPHQVPPPPQTTTTIKSGLGPIDAFIAFILAIFAYARAGKGYTHIVEIILLALFFLGLFYVLALYFLYPLADFLFAYPLAPIKWLAIIAWNKVILKVYHGVQWVGNWVIWGVQMCAWCAFYLHFAGKFVDGIVWGLERLAETPDEVERRRILTTIPTHQHADHANMHPQSYPPSGTYAQAQFHNEPEDDDDDDDEPPPLVPVENVARMS